MYIQKTTVSNGKEYPERELSDHETMEKVLRLFYLNQAGENITIESKYDDEYELKELYVTRVLENRTVYTKLTRA